VGIQIDLETNADKILEGTVGGAFYTLNTCTLEYDLIRDVALEHRYSGNPYTIKSIGIQHQDAPLLSANTSIMIQAPYRSVRGILFFIRDSATGIASQTTSNKMDTFLNNNLTNYYFRINGECIPQNPIDCSLGIASTRETLRLFGYDTDLATMNSEWATMANLKTLYGFSFQAHQGSISGTNMVSVNSPIMLNLTFSAHTANRAIDIYILYDTSVSFGDQNYSVIVISTHPRSI
jgi:hypothetical protein